MILATAESLANFSAIATTSLFLIAVVGGIVTYFLRKRGTSGQVSTSTADILWQQAQDMRSQLIKEKEAAEAQRDRLMDIQAEQVIPMLTAMNASLKLIITWQDGRALAFVNMEKDLISRLGARDE
jgi:Na+/glutamate symporter